MYRARYRRIVLFFARLVLNITFWDILLVRLGLRRWINRTRPKRLHHYAVAFRALAIQMGGVMIKVGQFLSTRVDVLPPEFTSVLADLQDEVPAENFAAIQKVAEAEYGIPLSEKFSSFNPTPLGAASLGQVHRARIGDEEVVVKIQRPDIEKIIATDLSALKTVGGWLMRYRPISRRADVPALLKEFSRTLYEEIDYLAEGRNAETFAEKFKDNPGVRVPKVYWTHTTQRALTLENVWAIKITDYAAITAAGIDRTEVAGRLLDTYLKQIFEDGFFHADPHPGNLFISPCKISTTPDGQSVPTNESKTTWRLTFIDFGMVGRVPDNLRLALRELLVGVGTQNASRVVKAYQTMGILLPGADLEQIERAGALLFERFWGKSLSELTKINMDEIMEFVAEFRDLLYTLPFQIPQDLIFLGRAVSILSGMCTGLDPNFNVWDHLAPYAQKLIAEEASGTGVTLWLHEVGDLARAILSIPRKMDSMLSRMERGEVAVRTPEISRQISRLEGAVRQVAGSLLFVGFLMGGIQLYLAGQLILAIILFVGAGLCIIWIWINGRRRSP